MLQFHQTPYDQIIEKEEKQEKITEVKRRHLPDTVVVRTREAEVSAQMPIRSRSSRRAESLRVDRIST